MEKPINRLVNRNDFYPSNADERETVLFMNRFSGSSVVGDRKKTESSNRSRCWAAADVDWARPEVELKTSSVDFYTI
jgi:hypothetical protein